MHWIRMRAATLLVAALGAAAVAEETLEAPAAPGPVIGLARVGAVEETLVERVRAFVEDRLSLPVRMRGSRPSAGGTLNEEAQAVADLIGPDVLCLVVLIRPEQPASPHGIVVPELKVGLVNVPALEPPGGDAERFGRRLERQAMRAVGLLFELGECPNPLCALWSYRTDEEMDAGSRDLCPPCTLRVQEAAQARGAVLIQRQYPVIEE